MRSGREQLKDQSGYRTTNLSHPLQDVHLVREHSPDLFRYRHAESLLPGNIEDMRVLELGGGIAEFSQRMRKRGIEACFVDLNEHSVERARDLGFEAHRADLNAGLGFFPDSSFDGVVMLEVIEHVVASEYLLEETARVLKPGGFLILSTPNFAFFLNRFRILRGKLSIDEGYHYRFFTVSVLEQKLRDAGLRVSATAHSAPAVGLNFFVNRLLHGRRRRLKIPHPMAALLAQTLMVRAERVPE